MDNIRYMMAIAHNSEENGAANKIMFMGGLAILAHLVSAKGEDVIPKWRGSKDLDVLLKDMNYYHIIKYSLDQVEADYDSPIARNKKTLVGSSIDSENRKLHKAGLDVFYPEGKPSDGIAIEEECIGDHEWSKRKRSDFFGIPVYHLGIMPLLRLKLNVLADRNPPRAQDVQDLCHLMGLAELQNYLHADVIAEITPQHREHLAKLLRGEYGYPACKGEKIIVSSPKYREPFTRK